MPWKVFLEREFLLSRVTYLEMSSLFRDQRHWRESGLSFFYLHLQVSDYLAKISLQSTLVNYKTLIKISSSFNVGGTYHKAWCKEMFSQLGEQKQESIACLPSSCTGLVQREMKSGDFSVSTAIKVITD